MAASTLVAAAPLPRTQEQGTRERTLLILDRVLDGHLFLDTWVRFAFAIGIVAGALIGRYAIGIENLDVISLLALAFVIASYNTVALFISRSYSQPERGAIGQGVLVRTMSAMIVLDYICLTIAVWLVGGARSPFLAFFLLHVIISCILLSRRMAIFSSSLAYVLLASLVISDWARLIPAKLPIGAVTGVGDLDYRFALTILVVFALLFGLTTFLLISLSQLLRRGERELHEANHELDRLSNVRRDFLQIAVHDVRAHVSGVVTILRNLRDGLVGDLQEKQLHWIKRSLKRLDGLTDLLNDLQMLSTLESSDIDAQMNHVDVGPMIRSLVEEYGDLARSRSHQLVALIAEALPAVHGIDRLLREAISNFITNAVKYTPSGGRIVVRACQRNDVVRIEVQDNGPGIAKEHQWRLFDEFVRVKVAGTTVSGSSGSGLGLSIVRHVVEKHRGRTGVDSEPGRGSTFFIELPAAG